MSVLTRALVVVVGLATLAASMSCASLATIRSEDRPPIIVENDSIHFSYDAPNISSKWKKEADDVYEQHHSNGKTVLSFSATVGTCTVTGAYRLVIHYGTGGMITLERHRKNNHYHTDAIFPDGTDLAKKVKLDNGSATKKMSFEVADKITRIDGDSGNCAVATGQKITVTMQQ